MGVKAVLKHAGAVSGSCRGLVCLPTLPGHPAKPLGPLVDKAPADTNGVGIWTIGTLSARSKRILARFAYPTRIVVERCHAVSVWRSSAVRLMVSDVFRPRAMELLLCDGLLRN